MDENKENGVKKAEKINLDTMYDEIGQFGKYQIIYVPIISLAMTAGIFYNEYVFSTAKIPHRCMIAECGETNISSFSPDWLVNAVPWKDGSPTSCERYQALGNGTLDYCPAELFDKSTTTECTGYVYKRTNTLVYDFDLGCQEWLRSLAGSLASAGGLLSLPIIGYISDKYGRRIVLVACTVNIGIFGILKAFSVNYTMNLVLQVLQTTFGYGYSGASHIFVSESVGPKYRILGNSICSGFTSIGQIWMGFVAWRFDHNWRYFLIALNTPVLAYGLFYFMLPESIRWLLSKKKNGQLKKELERIARINGKSIDEKELATFFEENEKDDIEKIPTPPRENLALYVMESKILLPRVAIISICWACSTFTYYGLSINSTSLSENTYLNYILTAIVQIPGFLLPAFFKTVGRKTALITSYFFAGLCNAAFVFTPNDMTALRLTSYLLGMTSISAVFATLHVFAVELYPTECRHSLYSFANLVSRLGSIAAPLTPALVRYLPTQIQTDDLPYTTDDRQQRTDVGQRTTEDRQQMTDDR